MNTKFLLLISLLWASASLLHAQSGSTTDYDFRDGEAIAAGQTADGVITFFEPYYYHGENYGLNMKAVGDEGEIGTIAVQVEGDATIAFLGSAHSTVNVIGTAVTTGDLGTRDAKVANDNVDTFEFTYAGPATTLTFTLEENGGPDLYLPKLTVTYPEEPEDPVAAEPGTTYVYDFADGSVWPQEYYTNLRYPAYTTEDGILTITATRTMRAISSAGTTSITGAYSSPVTASILP